MHLTQPSVLGVSAVLTQRHSALIPVCSEMFPFYERVAATLTRRGAFVQRHSLGVAGVLLLTLSYNMREFLRSSPVLWWSDRLLADVGPVMQGSCAARSGNITKWKDLPFLPGVFIPAGRSDTGGIMEAVTVQHQQQHNRRRPDAFTKDNLNHTQRSV